MGNDLFSAAAVGFVLYLTLVVSIVLALGVSVAVGLMHAALVAGLTAFAWITK